MKVKDILEAKGADVKTTTSDATMAEVVKTLNENRIGSLVVVDEGKITGIVSERDVLRKCLETGSDLGSVKVRDVMTPCSELATCGPDDIIDDVLNVINSKKIRHIPIVEGDSLVGMVSIGDVVHEMLAAVKSENKLLSDYILGKYPA